VISEEKIAEIRQSARISEFVGAHVSLKRRGRSLIGLCPFHNEKTPSFTVDDDRGFFHCFGCSAGGNVFKFVMLTESLSFPEAVRKVAARYGITVAEEGHASNARDVLFEVNASACRYFRRCLRETPAGEPMLAYLARRGIDEPTEERFVIGAAPASGDALVRWFKKEGIDVQLALKLGLLGQRGSSLYDKFRARLMFPIRDAQGRVVGFGGRVLDKAEGAKYLNSPESEIYHKSRALYGLYEARDALRNSESLLLVEGYFDVISLHQAGIQNSVASCGTALTLDQARVLRRYASEVVTLFDGDAAGETAGARSFPIFIEAGLWPRSTTLPAGEDPDTFVRTKGAAALQDAVAHAVPSADAYVRYVVKNTAGGDAGLARAGAELATLLAKVDDPFAHDLLVQKAALWTGISEQVLRKQARTQMPSSPSPSKPVQARRARAASGPEELLVLLLLTDPTLVQRLDETSVINAMEDTVWKGVADGIIRLIREGKSVDVAAVLEGLSEATRTRLSTQLIESDYSDVNVRVKTLEDCVRKIAETARRHHNRTVLDELRKREQLGMDLTPADELAAWRPRNRSDV
jgi:DNA primase